ncbi:MAG: hypothetical protein JJU15_00475 [Pararhodobacter sp.]|nr:hypothetical protein [Pararhodobacter sp.]
MSNISITDLPRALRNRGIEVTYNAIWLAATEGRIPAEKQGKRWFVKADDLPLVADAFAPAGQ